MKTLEEISPAVHVQLRGTQSPRTAQLLVATDESHLASEGTSLNLPEWIDPDIAPDRIRLAAHWALESDVRRIRQLQRTKLTKIDLRVECSGRHVYQPAGARGSGQLMLPILLGAPKTDRLLEHQVTGVSWLLASQDRLLADDMGLGKTVQAIAAARTLFQSGACRQMLVVCPKSMVGTWLDEFSCWAPELLVSGLVGEGDSLHGSLNSNHVVVTNYERVRDQGRVRVDLLVGDEAHRLRNLDSETSSAFRIVDRSRTWLLTGTPVERDQMDLASLMSILKPERFGVGDAKMLPGVLRVKAEPYVMRRTKADILTDLPPVRYVDKVISLSPEQKKEYDLVKNAWRPAKQGLAVINNLRRLCDLATGAESSSKVDETIEILARACRQGHKVVVFSYSLDPINVLRARCESELPEYSVLTFIGEMTTSERQACLKRFVHGEGPMILIASLRAAGEGLTLTVANHVVLFNQWWNPSANQQAIDRVVRMGQTREVTVYRFTCRDTIEERLQQLLEEKRDVFDKVIGQLAGSKGSWDVETLDILI